MAAKGDDQLAGCRFFDQLLHFIGIFVVAGLLKPVVHICHFRQPRPQWRPLDHNIPMTKTPLFPSMSFTFILLYFAPFPNRRTKKSRRFVQRDECFSPARSRRAIGVNGTVSQPAVFVLLAHCRKRTPVLPAAAARSAAAASGTADGFL